MSFRKIFSENASSRRASVSRKEFTFLLRKSVRHFSLVSFHIRNGLEGLQKAKITANSSLREAKFEGKKSEMHLIHSPS